MQVYYSALAFDKPGSLVQSHYRSLSPHALPNVFGHLEVVHAGGVTATAVSRTGDIIASAGNDLVIRLWSGNREETTRIVLASNSGVITSLAFSSDGKFLVSGSVDGMLSVWKVDEERQSTLVVALAGNGSEVECLAFSDDAKSIICGYGNGTISIWSIAEKRCLSSYTIPPLVSLPPFTIPNSLTIC
jgi:WD40 repeat protein